MFWLIKYGLSIVTFNLFYINWQNENTAVAGRHEKHKVVVASIVAAQIHKNYFLFFNFIQLIPQLIKINISNISTTNNAYFHSKTHCPTLWRLVFLYVQILLISLFIGLFGHGNVIFSS